MKTVEAFNLEADLQFRSDPQGGVVSEDMQYAFSLVNPNPLIIDVGCGYGRVIPHLRQIGPFRYIGIDPSIGMLGIGRREYPNIDFREMNLYELPQRFPESHFDIAIAITTMAYVSSVRMRDALTSIRKVLRPGGIGYFTFFADTETMYLAKNQPVGGNYKGPMTRLTGWKFERIAPKLFVTGFKTDQICVSDLGPYTVIAKAV